ncbi:hypothetical protein B0G62_104228 [Paraburkholderia eburnea]|uniref:Glycine zipper 2TM protein n=1 Tax=Paraburkholderia eburnea TaxID=1189126 RepID=A0A2S4ME49_9BURK|nr:hypothetical protein [Paraburkholderia eburnea]POR52931.1 hypothetical protein B0G62_104228 [Paraburkholderia eburnea]PRZ23798.1 hypothetical protein BX588_104227 [Paraburkholderia eburnea]
MKHHQKIGLFIATAALGLAAAGSANAAGCIKGAVVGGVAGHYAGHHAVVGAVGGCIVGHHLAKKQAEERAAAQHDADRAHQLPG